MITQQSRNITQERCRWISADALMDTSVGILGTNMYVYCNNDPVNYSDSTGYSITLAAGLLIGGFVVAGSIGGGFGGNAIANSLGAEGFERAGWIVSGVLTGGAVGGLAGWAAPAVAAFIAPAIPPVVDAVSATAEQLLQTVIPGDLHHVFDDPTHLLEPFLGSFSGNQTIAFNSVLYAARDYIAANGFPGRGGGFYCLCKWI